MKCNNARRLMPLEADSLLHGVKERQLELHLEECSDCRQEMNMMLKTGLLLKGLYKDAKAPSHLAESIMQRVSSEQASVNFKSYSPFDRLSRSYRPAIAIALSAAFILGVYAGRLVMPLTDIPPDEKYIQENGHVGIPETEQNELPVIEDSDIDYADPVLTAEPIEPAETDKEENAENAVIADAQDVLFDVKVSLPVPEDTIVHAGNGENYNREDTNFETVAVVPPSHIEDKKNEAQQVNDLDRLDTAKLQQDTVLIFNESDIPDASVFLRRSREIVTYSADMDVQRMDTALSQILNRAEYFGLKSEFTATKILDDGTLEVVKSFIVPSALVDLFMFHVSTFGFMTGRNRQVIDITSRYNELLERHQNLIVTMGISGSNAEQVRNTVKEMIMLDSLSKPRTQNVVLRLIDSVDF